MNNIIPVFTEEQQEFLVRNLIQMTPHRQIAKAFITLYDDFIPAGISYETYEEVFLTRSYNYTRDKRSKWYDIIKEGRAEDKDSIDHLSISYRKYRGQVRSQVTKDLEKLEAEIYEEKVDTERAKIKLTVIWKKLAVIESYEKNEREVARLSGQSLDSDDDETGMVESDFDDTGGE